MTKKLHLFLTMLLCAVSTASWADSWVKVSPSDLSTGDIVAIVDITTKTVMTNDNGASKPPVAASIELNSDNNELVSEVANNFKWEVTKTSDGYQFGVSDTENYLYCTNSNNGVRVGTNENNIFSFVKDDNGTDFLLNNGQSRYIGVYKNGDTPQDWRCYTSINNNIKDVVIAFFKYDSSGLANPTVTIDKTVLEVGETATVSTNGPSLTLTTTNAAVVSVSGNKVTGIAEGNATITAKWNANSTFNGGSKTFDITVIGNTTPGEYTTVTLPYTEDFTKSQGEFVIEDVSNPNNITIWTQGKTYGMTATAFVKLEGEEAKTNHASESWLISPIIDLSKATNPTLAFSDNWNKYFADYNNDFGVYIREKDGQWSKLNFTYTAPESGTFNPDYDDKQMDLSSYKGKKIQIGYKYTSTTEAAGTYEVKNFSVTDGQVVVKEDPVLRFEIDGEKVSNFTATIDKDNQFPTLYTEPANLPVKYSSTNTAFATIDETTGDITLIAEGQTTIKATFEGNDDYNPGEATYLLVVKEEAIPGTDVYELVSDVSALAVGDNIIIVNEDKTYAISTTQNANNRAGADVVENAGKIIPSNKVQVITLEKQNDYWLFNVGELGYLYAPSDKSNWLRSEVEADEKAQASITITEGVSEVKFNQWTENARTLLRYNKNNGIPIFSCYAPTATTGTPLRIYKKATPSGKLLGDVDGNGKINMIDVTAVINYILGKDPSPFIYENACMNDDPYINMQDVTAIINIILGK